MGGSAPVETTKMSGHGMMHWVCCWVPMLSWIFWVAAIVSLVLAWSAGDGMIWGKADAFWYLNSLALGVLAMGGKGKRMHKGGCCGKGACANGVCAGGACGSCKEGSCK